MRGTSAKEHGKRISIHHTLRIDNLSTTVQQHRPREASHGHGHGKHKPKQLGQSYDKALGMATRVKSKGWELLKAKLIGSLSIAGTMIGAYNDDDR